MHLNQIKSFLAVSKTLNFTNAARQNGVPQSTISRHINDLEQQLGVRLFYRTKRDVQLTEEGRTFIPYAQEILDAARKGAYAVKQLHEGARGRLAIATIPTSSGILRECLRDFGRAWVTFFRKPGILLAVVFMLLYRLPEAFSVKMLTPFMLDPVSEGGLGLTTAQSGLVYGTVGVIALTLGGILGGIYAARYGLRRSLWPMSLSLALPCAVYLIMALMQPEQLWFIYFCVAFDQFGYGFGFTAYMLYMMHFSEGEFKTSHYAICTAFMALSMMVPGIFAGWLQEALGYVGFFIMVMICCIATVSVTWFARRRC